MANRQTETTRTKKKPDAQQAQERDEPLIQTAWESFPFPELEWPSQERKKN